MLTGSGNVSLFPGQLGRCRLQNPPGVRRGLGAGDVVLDAVRQPAQGGEAAASLRSPASLRPPASLHPCGPQRPCGPQHPCNPQPPPGRELWGGRTWSLVGWGQIRIGKIGEDRQPRWQGLQILLFKGRWSLLWVAVCVSGQTLASWQSPGHR